VDKFCYLGDMLSVDADAAQLNSTQPEIKDAGVNTSKSESLCSYYFKKKTLLIYDYS